MKVLALTLAAFGLLVGTAEAGPTVLRPDGTPATNWQRIADRSHAPTPDLTLRISRDLEGTCHRTDVAGCAARRTGVMALSLYAHKWTFYHELGHFFDYMYLTPEWHARFAGLFGEPQREWEVDDSDYDLLEVFANLYSWCAVGRPLRGLRWNTRHWENVDTGVRLNRRQVRAGCWMIWQASPHTVAVPA